jgi:hypothetical protein
MSGQHISSVPVPVCFLCSSSCPEQALLISVCASQAAASATLQSPYAIAFDSYGNLYISEESEWHIV